MACMCYDAAMVRCITCMSLTGGDGSMWILYSLVLVFKDGNLVDHGLDDLEVYGTSLGHHGVRFFSQNRRDFDDLVFNLLPLQALREAKEGTYVPVCDMIRRYMRRLRARMMSYVQAIHEASEGTYDII